MYRRTTFSNSRPVETIEVERTPEGEATVRRLDADQRLVEERPATAREEALLRAEERAEQRQSDLSRLRGSENADIQALLRVLHVDEEAESEG